MFDLIAVLTGHEIETPAVRVAPKISSGYQGRVLILIGVFIFLSNLARPLGILVKIGFLRAANYGSNSSISGKIQLKKDLKIEIEEKDVRAVVFCNLPGVFKITKIANGV